jgi:DNA-binding CsgD family transcriptional regulator
MSLSTLLANPEIVRWHEEIADLFDYSTDEQLPARLSEAFNKVVRHEAFILKLYRAGNDLPVILSHDIPSHLHEVYFNRYLSYAYLEDPLLPRVQRNNVTQIVQINPETCPLKGSDYYRRYYKDLSLQDEVDLLLPMTNGDSLVLSIGRKAAITTRQEMVALSNTSALVRSILTAYHRTRVSSGDASAAGEPPGLNAVDKLLTSRERQVVHLMVSGKGTKEIARCLDISIQTVKVHRRNIYSKLGVGTELQLCSMFLSAHLRPGGFASV